MLSPWGMEQLREKLLLAERWDQGDPPKLPSGEYKVAESREEVISWLLRYESKPLVFDIEGQGDPSILHPTASDVICVGLHGGDETLIVPRRVLGAPDRHRKPGETLREFPEMWDALARTLLVAHNAKFDAIVLGQWLSGGVLNPLPTYRDTMLMYYVLSPAVPHKELKLTLMCERMFGAEDWSVPDYSDMWGYSEAELFTYCAKDVQYEWMVFEELHERVQGNPDRRKTMELVVQPFTELTTEAEPNGVCFDYDYVMGEAIPAKRREKERTLIELQQIADAYTPEGGWPRKKDEARSVKGKPVWKTDFNPSSWQQVKHVLAARGTEAVSTDEKTLAPLAEKGDQFAKSLLEYRGVTKELGTYLESALSRNEAAQHPFGDNRIFPSYNVFGTLTGRLSSSGPNIQNQPKTKEMRRMYVASTPERVVMQADYSQAELRVMAALANDDWLLGIFANPDLDIFDEMMPGAFPDREFIKGTEEADFMRRSLKTVVYGLAYDRQAAAIAIELGMTVRQAKALMDNFLSSADDLAELRREIRKKAHQPNGLVTRFGRYFQHEVITPANKASVERSALSFLPQSSASDCCLVSAIRLRDWIKKNHKDWTFFALVHDAINLDVPKEEGQEASEVTRKIMCETAAEFFPEVAWKAEGDWGWSWDKT